MPAVGEMLTDMLRFACLTSAPLLLGLVVRELVAGADRGVALLLGAVLVVAIPAVVAAGQHGSVVQLACALAGIGLSVGTLVHRRRVQARRDWAYLAAIALYGRPERHPVGARRRG